MEFPTFGLTLKNGRARKSDEFEFLGRFAIRRTVTVGPDSFRFKSFAD